MDMEQEELQFLDLLGIYKESCKLIYNQRKILTQINLSLILPLPFIFLAQEKVSELLFGNILFNEFRLHKSRPESLRHGNLSNLVSFERAEFVLFKLVYIALALVFSLLSTSTIVYSVACSYTSREITFKKIMSVVPRVWKGLTTTLLCYFLAPFNVGVVLALLVRASTISGYTTGTLVYIVVLILHASVFTYLMIISQLMIAVSVLEDSYGIKALMKSKSLMKGKMLLAAAISFKINVSILLLNYVFKVFRVYSCFFEKGSAWSLGFGALCVFISSMLIMSALVVQTIFYLVCISYHHETIDKPALSEHLKVNLGDYVLLMV